MTAGARLQRLVVVSGGLSEPSSTRLLADRLTAAVVAEAGGPVDVTVIELRTLAHDLADRLVTGFAPPALATAQEQVRRADALVVVTPVFAASYAGLFKTFFDVLEPGVLAGTPVLVGATAGTARHSLVLDHALRPLFAYLRAVVVPTGVFAATDDFADGGLADRVRRAAAELVALLGGPGGAAGSAASAPAGADHDRPRTFEEQVADPTPFSELLRRASGPQA